MYRDIAVLVPGEPGEQDTVYVVRALNAATARSEVSEAAGVDRSETRFVQMKRVHGGGSG